MRLSKKIFAGILLLSTFTLSSCNINLLAKEPAASQTKIVTVTTEDYTVPTPYTQGDYKVTFICNNGYVYETTTTQMNKVLEPENPEKICATFKGWFKDQACTELFDFTKSVEQDVYLFAKWDIDYVSLVNLASEKYMLANVRLFITNYDREVPSSLFPMQNASTTLGSGVIFYESSGYYYALTNNHVVYATATYQKRTLEDAYEREYDFNVVAQDAAYDLAIICFRKSDDLCVVPLANYDSSKNELVFAFGEPNGLSNTLTMGYILGNKVFEPEASTKEYSNVTFSVYLNSAPIDSGSSGGALLDSNMKLIGINFASAYNSETKEYKYTYTIPSERVREFILKYLDITI